MFALNFSLRTDVRDIDLQYLRTSVYTKDNCERFRRKRTYLTTCLLNNSKSLCSVRRSGPIISVLVHRIMRSRFEAWCSNIMLCS